MFEYILFATFLLCYQLELHYIVWHFIQVKKDKLLSLKSLVSTQHKNTLKIFWVCLVMIFKTLYLQLLQQLNSTVRRIDKNTFEVSYVLNGVMHKILIKPKRGPKPIIDCVDENDNDLTLEILPYVGPEHNFHGSKLSPRFFGRQKLIMNLSNGEEREFNEHDDLDLSL